MVQLKRITDRERLVAVQVMGPGRHVEPNGFERAVGAKLLATELDVLLFHDNRFAHQHHVLRAENRG